MIETNAPVTAALPMPFMSHPSSVISVTENQ